MAQVLATIFFSATALTASGVIASTLIENLGDVRRALSFGEAMPLAPSRFRLRRLDRMRPAVRASHRVNLPMRAVA